MTTCFCRIPVTTEERIRNLNMLGYTAREAEFLCLAALHSGYFVRRQFLDFTTRSRGNLDTKLVEKLIASGHASLLQFPHNRRVYSFCSKPFYEAIGDVDNRNRRTHEALTIKRRLLGVDFILRHTEGFFFGTEREKVEYFRDVRNVRTEYLPIKSYRSKGSSCAADRYFVEKFPIGVSRADLSTDQPVDFCFIDPNHHGDSGFELYLRQYLALLTRVGIARVFYVSPFTNRFPAAREFFSRVVARQDEQTNSDPNLDRLLQFFRDRKAFDRGELAAFTQAKLIQFREDRRAFSSDQYDSLFAIWKDGGDATVMKILCPESGANRTPKCEFQTFQSPFNYELFGTPRSVLSQRSKVPSDERRGERSSAATAHAVVHPGFHLDVDSK